MKTHLIEILYTEFRINRLLDELEEKGIQIDFNGLDFANWDIVVDIIGFPKDNSVEIFTEFRNKEESNDDPCDFGEMFCRDWLMNDYFDRLKSLEKEQDIYFEDELLKTKTRYNEKAIKTALSEHIDWLKDEYEKHIS